MGIAIDTVAGFAVNPGGTVTAVTMATGDSATVRSFPPSASAVLDNVFRQGGTEGFVRVRSPLLHDFVRGIAFTPSETPAAQLLPRYVDQRLQPQDALTIEVSGGAAETDVVALGIAYSDLAGAMARLHSPGDISGLIKNVKPVEVDFSTNATIGQWQDTVITTTENLLHANTDYAVIGYVVDVALCAFGVRGIDTSNLRVCGAGTTRSEVTSGWFWDQSLASGRPCIPVINSANQGSIFVTAVAATSATAVKSSLILAELVHTV